ncbi:MAG: riboflavin synthase [Armatimonadota bacterium]|nr:riboflavin synthase [Armatimonadota bacterium]
MFTGLIEEIGVVEALQLGAVAHLRVRSEHVASKVNIGDSVSVSGVCLTVTSVGSLRISFDAVQETLARSTLCELRPGDEVNLETSLRAGGQIGGHFVMGHVDGVGTVQSVKRIADSAELFIEAPDSVLRYVVEKGSIAVDGVSLTIVSVDDAGFSVAVIPHTLKATTLGKKRVGDRVNLEADIIGKYVEKFLNRMETKPDITAEYLRKAGFL